MITIHSHFTYRAFTVRSQEDQDRVTININVYLHQTLNHLCRIVQGSQLNNVKMFTKDT